MADLIYTLVELHKESGLVYAKMLHTLARWAYARLLIDATDYNNLLAMPNVKVIKGA